MCLPTAATCRRGPRVCPRDFAREGEGVGGDVAGVSEAVLVILGAGQVAGVGLKAAVDGEVVGGLVPEVALADPAVHTPAVSKQQRGRVGWGAATCAP